MIQSNYSTRSASMGFTRVLRRPGNRQAKSAASPKVKTRFAKNGDHADGC
jgi:hypothetical protein